MPNPQRKFPYFGPNIPTEEFGIVVGDLWVDTNEATPIQKICSSVDPVTFYVTAEPYILPDDVLQSQPPSGYYRVKNIAVNPGTGKLWVQYDDTPIE